MLSALLRLVVRRLDRPALPKYSGSLTIPGLKHRVTIRWGSHAIPHVFAADEHDLFLAQGYLHAQERLWQMEMARRFLSGRTAELFGNFPLPWKEVSTHFRGADAVEFDYFMRLIGIRHAAYASLAALADGEAEKLEAYSAGVNRYIEACGKKLPWEFRALRCDPEPWQAVDSLTIGKGFAFLLSPALFTRLNMIALAVKLRDAPEKFRSLVPSHPADAPTITRALWDAAESLWRFMGGTLGTADWQPAGAGSNSWVVAPGRSLTGRAILCNDPHLRLTLPSMWYLIHLQAQADSASADGYEVCGASIPGTPCVQIGHNRRIAWGITAAICDDVELYREKIHPLEADRYLADGEWRIVESREEEIGIRGTRPIRRLVRTTRHGPIISDFGRGGKPSDTLALRWSAHETGRDFRCLYGVNRARNWSEFLDALSHQSAPTLNFVFADAEGNIGYSLAGKIPRRPEPPSLLPLDGWRAENDWQGFIPFAELPRVYNPPEGVIATANHRIVDSSYPYYLSHLFEPPYRIRRIHQLLGRKPAFSVRDMAEMQMDVVSLHAAECIDILREDLLQLANQSPNLKPAAQCLLQWDCACGARSIAAAIFHLFYQRLMANLLVPALGEELFDTLIEIFNQCLVPVMQILKDPASPWFAERTRSEIVARALQQSCAELRETFGEDMRQWEWGKLHTLRLSHSLGRGRILRHALSIAPFAAPGDGITINVGYYRYSNPFEQTVGASLRFIAAGDDWRQSYFILPGGQSGHPFSPHYEDQLPLWRSGESVCIAVEKESAPCLILAASSAGTNLPENEPSKTAPPH